MKERKGFTRIPNWLISSNVLSTTEKMVVILVASFADGCKLSAGELAGQLGLHVNTMRATIKRLVDAGIITTEKCEGKPNIMTVDVENTLHKICIDYPIQNLDRVPYTKIVYTKIVGGNKNCIDPLHKNCIGSYINKRKDNIPPPYMRACVRENFAQKLAQEKVWLEGVCMRRGIDEAMMLVYLQDFANYCEDVEKQHESLEDAKRHFINQLPTIIKRHEQDNDNRPGGAQRAADYAQRIAAIGATGASLTDDAW